MRIVIANRNKDVQVHSEKAFSRVDRNKSGSVTKVAAEMVTEMGLLQKAGPFVEALCGRLPTHAELRVIRDEMGSDFATAVLAKAIHASHVHGPFASQVRAYDLTQVMSARAPMRQITRQFEVVLVASNLPESGRKWGDHIELWRMWARQMGFTTDDIQTLPHYTISQNARVIAEHLGNRYHPHRIVVTFGQGSSEFRFLLEKRLAERDRDLGALASVRAWLNICGSFGGSARHAMINRSWLRRMTTGLRMRLDGRQPVTLMETSSNYPLWRRKMNVPPETLVASLFGLTYGAQMPQGLNSSYLELAHLGPNDGAVLSLDAIAHPGLVVPVSGLTAKGESSLLEPMLKKLLLTTAEMMAPVLTPMASPAIFSSLDLGMAANSPPDLKRPTPQNAPFSLDQNTELDLQRISN